MKTKREIKRMLPTSWDDFKLRDYMKCVDIVIKEDNGNFADELLSGLDNTLSIISKLTDVPINELEGLDYAFIQELGMMLSFMKELPKVSGKTALKWKSVEDITYNDFIFFLTQAKDAVHGMPEIIKAFAREDDLTDEMILDLSMTDVHSFFLKLNLQTRKYINRLIRKEGLDLAKLQLKTLINRKSKTKRKN
jgi:hypothetical protein